MPDRRHAANDRRANQNQCHRPVGGCENADHALVAREQVRDCARSCRINRKQRARHVDHSRQASIAGHVNAVVILRAQVQVREAPVLELRGKHRIAPHQCPRRIVMPFCLEDLIAFDRAKLTDGAINGTNVIGACKRARIRSQGACKEIVKSAVRADIRIVRLIEIDAVTTHKPADQTGG